MDPARFQRYRRCFCVLEGNQPVPAASQEAWTAWMESNLPRFRLDDSVAGYAVSTMFTGFDWRCIGFPEPWYFDTRIDHPQWKERRWSYNTWPEARAGPLHVLALFREWLESGEP